MAQIPWSNIILISDNTFVCSAVPDPPRNLQLSCDHGEDGKVEVSWTPPDKGNGLIREYIVSDEWIRFCLSSSIMFSMFISPQLKLLHHSNSNTLIQPLLNQPGSDVLHAHGHSVSHWQHEKLIGYIKKNSCHSSSSSASVTSTVCCNVCVCVCVCLHGARLSTASK